MHDLAKKMSEEMLRKKEVLVVTHIDADGISAGSIACASLREAGIDHDIMFVKSLDEDAVTAVLDRSPEFVWFTDIGAGSYELVSEMSGVITDHHVPSESYERSVHGRLTPRIESEGIGMLNPHWYGMDGSLDISGAGVTYLLAREMDRRNVRLSCLAIVGAVGDMQDRNHGRLIGSNRTILRDAELCELVRADTDIRYFGRETRPLPRLLAYGTDPLLPGLNGNHGACVRFLEELDIAVKDNDRWRCWSDLSLAEARRVLSGIVVMLLESGLSRDSIERIVGECYTLTRERERSPLRDAKEFATLLNSCGRYEKARVGMEICLGDREDSLDEAMDLLRAHREYLVESLEIAAEMGIIELDHLQYFHGGARIKDTVIGIAAGILLSSPEVDKSRPLFAFASSEDGVKVSARATKVQVSRGIDLSVVMRGAAEPVGGKGGGHNIAAGASIPFSREEEFLELAQKIICEQTRSE
jgi:RecJ-like exonuclease